MGKTETTYLIDGDPKETQYVFLTVGSSGKTRVVRHLMLCIESNWNKLINFL